VSRKTTSTRLMTDQPQSLDNWEYKFLTAGASKQKAMKAILDRQKDDLKQSGYLSMKRMTAYLLKSFIGKKWKRCSKLVIWSSNHFHDFLTILVRAYQIAAFFGM